MNLSKKQELLCIALSSDTEINKKEEFIRLYNGLNKKELNEEAITDEVFTHLSYLILKFNLSEDKLYVKALDEISLKMSKMLEELDQIANSFQKHDIITVALKNAGILKGIYTNKFCSPMGDLDLLVKKSDFIKAHELMVNDLGYVFKFRSVLENENLAEALLHGGGEYFKIVSGEKIWGRNSMAPCSWSMDTRI